MFFLRSHFQQQSCNGASGRLAEAPAQTSVCANNGDLDYMNALGMSIMFYEANMAGELPAWHRIPWRGDSTLRGLIKSFYIKFLCLPKPGTKTSLYFNLVPNPEL